MKKEFTVSSKKYTLCWTTGKVVGQGKYSTTHVSSSGGGTGDFATPINVSSTTNVHNDVFLEDKEGKEGEKPEAEAAKAEEKKPEKAKEKKEKK